MSKNRIECNLYVYNIDDGIKRVVDLLCESHGTAEDKTKAFVLWGWVYFGLGAPAVRAIAKLLKRNDSDKKRYFSKIFHVDCSQCKNRRAIQREIAQELNLHHVLHIFDKQDEDDDFRGLDDGSRKEIGSIRRLINLSLRDERFLMILQYGGVDNIDLVECGIPTFGNGKLLCTNYYGGFQIGREETMLIPSFPIIDITMCLIGKVTMPLRRVLHEEAMEVIDDIGMEGMNPSIVLDCFLYSVTLTAQLPENNIGVDNGWATHACNYWICDGILGEDKSWEIHNALYRVMPPLGYSSDETRWLLHILDIKEWRSTDPTVCCWYPVTNKKLGGENICNVPDCASSYFLTFQGDDPLYIPNDLFQLASNLRVLKLYNCSFDFSSPPFQCCHNLRFLWLDHCTNTGKEQSGVPFFPNLLVFDLRFTEYVLLAQMVELMTNLGELNTRGVSWKTMTWQKLQKLHKLRVTESSDVVTVHNCSSIDVMNLELLDLSGNTHMESLPIISSARSLKMLVLDGCSSLENVALDMERAPPLLESFSFDGYGPAENWTHFIQLPQKELRLKSPIAPVEIVQVTKISLDGCVRLNNIFLRALPNLEELDLSGTTITILDLSAMEVPKLKKLFLLGCHQLRSLILYGVPSLEMLHVDTWRNKRSINCCGGQGSFGSHAFIAFTDGRFTWLFTRKNSICCWYNFSKVYMLISCMSHTQANIKKKFKEIGSSQEGLVPTSLLLPYNNIASIEDVTCSSLVWNHQPLQTLDNHIEIGEGSFNLERMRDSEGFVGFVRDVQSLHVHDNSSITAIPPADGVYWEMLEWCHVERCPKLHTLFSWKNGRYIFELRIFSASDLLVVYCIWARGINILGSSSFQQLQHIYLYNCPRLVFVLPISFTLPDLETLQIAYCSNLRHVFPLDDKYPPEIASRVTFKNLKHIKLYHLHSLEQICEARLTAPALQTISLRDCWGLRRLPAVARQGPKPVVDCEKDWWNRLEWDVLDAGHEPSLFETRHSAYYKKTLPRISVLR